MYDLTKLSKALVEGDAPEVRQLAQAGLDAIIDDLEMAGM